MPDSFRVPLNAEAESQVVSLHSLNQAIVLRKRRDS
jgi:hypothetical protein